LENCLTEQEEQNTGMWFVEDYNFYPVAHEKNASILTLPQQNKCDIISFSADTNEQLTNSKLRKSRN
jgi:hypothetical protein